MLGGTDLNLTPLPLVPVGVGGIFGGEGFLQGEAEGESDSFAVGRVCAVAVADVTLLDEECGVTHGPRSVFAGLDPVA